MHYLYLLDKHCDVLSDYEWVVLTYLCVCGCVCDIACVSVCCLALFFRFSHCLCLGFPHYLSFIYVLSAPLSLIPSAFHVCACLCARVTFFLLPFPLNFPTDRHQYRCSPMTHWCACWCFSSRLQGDKGDRGDRGLTTTIKGDEFPTGIIEGPPGPPGPPGKCHRGKRKIKSLEAAGEPVCIRLKAT